MFKLIIVFCVSHLLAFALGYRRCDVDNQLEQIRKGVRK